MDSTLIKLMAFLGVLAALTSHTRVALANKPVSVTCESVSDSPTVIATLSHRGVTQTTPILSFLPKYFSSQEADSLCKSTAAKLDVFYAEHRMNYLASDSINEKPAVCAVERRGLDCESYGSYTLFTLNEAVSPTELLYSMLDANFKGPRLPSSRTVSRIYSDLYPSWWPFDP